MKKIFKLITSVLLIGILMAGTVVPAFAAQPKESTIELDGKTYTISELLKKYGNTTTKNTPDNATVSASNLADGKPVTQTLNGIGIFPINVSDANMKYLSVSSGTPVRTILKPTNTSMQSSINFDSVDPRPMSMISWHFIPGLDYTLFVIPQSYPATVTVSLSTSGGTSASWVYDASTPSFIEKNILSGGQTETYGIAFQTPGTYLYTIKSVVQLQLNYIDSFDSNNNKLGRTIYPNVPFSFSTTIINTGYAQNDYGVYLYNPGSPNAGGAYSVTVTKS